MKSVKKQNSVVNFQNLKWLIFQPELLLIILSIFLLSSCSDDFDEVVPFSNKTSKNPGEHRIPTAPNTVTMEAHQYYD